MGTGTPGSLSERVLGSLTLSPAGQTDLVYTGAKGIKSK